MAIALSIATEVRANRILALRPLLESRKRFIILLMLLDYKQPISKPGALLRLRILSRRLYLRENLS